MAEGSDRTTTETLNLIKPQTSEAVMIADINNNSQVIDSAFAGGRMFKSVAPGAGATGSAIIARTNKDIVAETKSITDYGDTLIIGCEKGISIDLNSSTKKLIISHTHADLEAGSRGNEYTVPVIQWDAQGHLTSIGSSTIYPPDTPGAPGQVWIAVERATDDPNKKGAWATLTTDGIISATPSKQQSANTIISITHAKANTNRTSMTIGSSNRVPMLKYDEYGHIIYADAIPMYPPTSKGTSGQVWLSVGVEGSENGAWVDQSSLYVGRSKAADEASKLPTSQDKGDELTPVYFKNGLPALCTRRIPAFENTSHISYTEADNEMISMKLTGFYETPSADIVGDNLITAGWALDKLADKQDAALEAQISLKADKWSPVSVEAGYPFQQTMELGDLTPNATILVSPTNGSEEMWYDCGMFTMAQGNGWIQFHSDVIPPKDIEVQLAWLPKNT